MLGSIYLVMKISPFWSVDLLMRLNRSTKAKDFEGEGGLEDKQRRYEEDNPGNEDILSNVRQGGETRRP